MSKKPIKSPSRKTPANSSPQRITWDETLALFDTVYVSDEKLRNALTIGGAVVTACRIPGDPLWVFLVGPPSTGKTVVIDLFGLDKENCEEISKLSATQLVSGYKDPEDPDSDPSIFSRLKNRALLIKDYTTVIAMPSQEQEALYGILRDAYDGHVRIQYGNNKLFDVSNTYFSLLAGVTDVIKQDNRADLGERFLRCEVIDDRTYDRFAVAQAAIEASVMTNGRREQINSLGKFVQAAMSYAHQQCDLAANDKRPYPKLTPAVATQLNYLSQIVGRLRTVVPRKGEEILYRPRPEGGARVAKQLMKLGMSLAFLLDSPDIDQTIYSYIRRTALDTITGYRLQICQQLAAKPGMDAQEIGNRITIGKTGTLRLLRDLQAIGAVRFSKAQNGYSGGRDVHLWFPTHDFSYEWDKAGLNQKTKVRI